MSKNLRSGELARKQTNCTPLFESLISKIGAERQAPAVADVVRGTGAASRAVHVAGDMVVRRGRRGERTDPARERASL